MSSHVALKVDNLCKTYKLYDKPIDRMKEALHPMRKTYHRDFHALSNFNISVNQGETVGVIGQNGAGKSTLLKIITGVLTPNSGTMVVNGKVSALLELGTGFNPELTGIENVYFAGALLGYDNQEMKARLDDIISFADIGEYISQPVKTYSSGMFARLAFAVAINVDPDILIVDEALSVGDMNFQARCFAKFKEFQEQGKTILFVTHSLDLVLRYCQRAVLIERGMKVLDGDPKPVVDAFKRIITGHSLEPEASVSVASKEDSVYKDKFEMNRDSHEYGNNQVEIYDFGIFDHSDHPTQRLFAGDEFKVKMRIAFKATIKTPIFAYTIKDLKGNEITGTNTFFEKIDTGTCENGGKREVVFTQAMRLQSGSYALSLGCTNFEKDDFVVYSRLYDIMLFEVISHKHMVGVFDSTSTIEIEPLN